MNWSPTAADTGQAVRVSSMTNPLESHTRLEIFRRQSQTSTFRLGHGNLSHFSQSSKYGQSPPLEKSRDRREGATPPILQKPTSHIESEGRQGQDGMDIDSQSTRRLCSNDGSPLFLGIPPNQSPSETPPLDLSRMQADRAHFLDEGHRPNSLPHIITATSSLGPSQRVVQRAETLPVSLNGSGPTMISPQELVDIMNSHVDMLLLDLRVFPQFSLSRISGAVNLCIPTTLLKRPSFNVQKLTETFTKENERAKFSGWKEAQVIAVYDAYSTQLKDAVSSVNTLKKFTNENWHGSTVVLRGGFSEFSKKFPDMVDKRTTSEMESSGSGKLAIDPLVPTAAPVAGGCVMPVSQTAANPFFGNIRQNMDLIGGVGQMAIKLPSAIKENVLIALPTWLKRATSEKDNGKIVADCFLSIEKDEQQRMQKALSTNVSYGTPNPSSTQCIQIAGFEKGVKNRYKDILPFDHSRVRLKNVQPGSCDYINASHIKPQWSHRHYIATQAPVPTTFQVRRLSSES